MEAGRLKKGLLVACLALVLACGATAAPPKKSSRLPVYKALAADGERYEVCNTPECTIAAADLIEAMDLSVDPCQDFYQFACGSWIASNPVPDDSSKWAMFDVLDRALMNALASILTEPISPDDPEPINKAKDYYTACIDEGLLETIGLTPLTDFLDQFGGWPMTNGNWSDAVFDWQFSVSEARRQVGADYLVSVWVFADEKDTFSTAIYIDQTSLGMPRSILTNTGDYQEVVDAYKTYMATTGGIIGSFLGQDTSNILADVEDVVNFEIALAGITTPAEERRNIDRMYNPMTVSELDQITAGSGIDWVQMLSSMFTDANIAIDASTRVIVQEIEYLQNMTSLIATTSSRTLSNYIMWRHVKSLGDETNGAMREASFEYDMVANGVNAQKPRDEVCAEKTNNYMGQAIGIKYVESYFSQQAKDEVNAMVEDLRMAFEDLLAVNQWMDAETKPLAMEKAEAISKSIGYPDWYGDDAALLAYYSDLGDITTTTHFQNTLNLKSWMSTDELNDFGLPTDRERWYMPPAYVNAYYMPEFNSINFPAGILQSPFYRANTLQALNFGGIGQVIGHEITHGFDDQGRQNDKDGNAIPWWTNATLEAFLEKAQCIVDQYDNIRLPEVDYIMPNATLNGINTQGENIADNGGLREALLAYLKYVNRTGEEPRLPGLVDYTPVQLFFLSNANIWCTSITDNGLVNQILTDPHSPGEFRVKVPMANLAEFSTAWSCPVDSPMNPTDKCVVW